MNLSKLAKSWLQSTSNHLAQSATSITNSVFMLITPIDHTYCRPCAFSSCTQLVSFPAHTMHAREKGLGTLVPILGSAISAIVISYIDLYWDHVTTCIGSYWPDHMMVRKTPQNPCFTRYSTYSPSVF